MEPRDGRRRAVRRVEFANVAQMMMYFPLLSEGGNMRIKSVQVLGVLIILIGWSTASAQLKKVRFSTTGISISELPFKVAQIKGSGARKASMSKQFLSAVR